MTFLDAYALIAFLSGGPAAPQVRAILRGGDAALATVNLAETLDVSRRTYGLAIGRALELLEPLFDGALVTVPLDLAVARSAADIRSRHYHRTRRPISLGDAVLIASAAKGDSVATADRHVLAVAADEGLGVVALPGQS